MEIDSKYFMSIKRAVRQILNNKRAIKALIESLGEQESDLLSFSEEKKDYAILLFKDFRNFHDKPDPEIMEISKDYNQRSLAMNQFRTALESGKEEDIDSSLWKILRKTEYTVSLIEAVGTKVRHLQDMFQTYEDDAYRLISDAELHSSLMKKAIKVNKTNKILGNLYFALTGEYL